EVLFMGCFIFFVLISTGFSQTTPVNLVLNPGLETVVGCPGTGGLALGHHDLLTYNNSNVGPTPYVPPWFATHAEYALSSNLHSALGCTGSGYQYPGSVSGSGSTNPVWPSSTTFPNNSFAALWGTHGAGINGTSTSYRVEYLTGRLTQDLVPGIDYTTNFEYALPSHFNYPYGFRRLGMLFYNRNSQGNPQNYAIPPGVTNFSQLGQTPFVLSDNPAFWSSGGRDANIIMFQKNQGVWGDQVLGDVSWEQVADPNIFLTPEFAGQNTFTLGVFYQPTDGSGTFNTDLLDTTNPDALIGYNWNGINGSGFLDQPNSFSTYGYYDNVNVSCQSNPIFDLIHNTDELIISNENDQIEISVNCYDELEVRPRLKDPITQTLGNFHQYMWNIIEGGTSSTLQAIDTITYEEHLDELADPSLTIDLIQALKDHNNEPIAGKTFEVGFSSSCHEQIISGSYSSIQPNKRAIVYVDEINTDDMNIFVHQAPYSYQTTNSDYEINLAKLAQAQIAHGFDVEITNLDQVPHYEIEWAITHIGENNLQTVEYEETTINQPMLHLDLKKLNQAGYALHRGGKFILSAKINFENDCQELDREITVNVKSSFYVPNSFSPNGDGINDQFRIFPSDADLNHFKIEEFAVFGRNGGTLFSCGGKLRFDNPTCFWNGKSKGKAVNPGMYVGMLRYSTPHHGVRTIGFEVNVIK
ncbi:gliding motility-associated C-terminal domain-containing protein, partial [Bacteriovoracaceae bacterium]|nr:gliding motility-associated C-terminal domain-containing protein [Bacteriovoracaceae bacterium]